MSGLVLVFDLDDTLYPERQYALSGFKAAERWAAPELGIEGLAADMTRLLDDGHLGALFRMALARKLPELPSQRVGRQPCASGGTMQKERASNRPVGGPLAIIDNSRKTLPTRLAQTRRRLCRSVILWRGMPTAGRAPRDVVGR